MSSETTPRDGDRSAVAADQSTEPEPAVAGPISRARRLWVSALIAFATLLAVVGMLSIWANRLLFDVDNWESTSTQLLQNSAVRSATANYIVDQIYANVDVERLIGARLPPRFRGLAIPAANALQTGAVRATEVALARARVQRLWAKANRRADETFIAIVRGHNGAVAVTGGAVTLDLASIVDTVAARLGLPAGARSKLPLSVGRLTLFRSDQLKYVQTGGNALRVLALWLTIVVPLLYALALFLARGRRRRTLMTIGFAITFAGLLAIAGRSILKSQVTDALVSDASLRPAVRAVVAIVTGMLGEIAGAFVLVGAVVVLAGWFAGPARMIVPARRAIAPFLREQPVATFAITIAVMVLVFIWDPIPATGTAVGIVLFMALALVGVAALRHQTALEFPAKRAPVSQPTSSGG